MLLTRKVYKYKWFYFIMKKEMDMVVLIPKFQKILFQRVVDKFGGSLKASKVLGIPAVSIRGYKNLRFKSVPKKIINKLLEHNITNSLELNKKTKSIFNKKELTKKNLDKGRKIRNQKLKEWKKEIPELKLILNKNSLDFERWFYSYKKLINFGARKFNYIKKERDYLEVSYTTHSNKDKKEFILKFPRKIVIDHRFIYFFGLWCGDRAGGKRFGICNQNKDILDFTEDFLKKNYQNVEKILYISKSLKEPDIFYDKKFIIDKEIKGWVLSVHSINGIFSSFFYYLQNYLEDFLRKINNLECFFAGLFDAEGNVSLYNKSFRWACKNEKLVNIYSKYLNKVGLYDRYDGCCLISYNKNSFYNNLLPYLKHGKKIKHSLFLCKGEGEIPEDLKKVLIYLKKNPLSTQKEIAKALKKSKVYSELGLLREFGFILVEGHPLRFKLNNEKIISGV